MHLLRHTPFFRRVLWKRTVVLSLVLFFIFLADALMSYWVPVFIHDVYESTTMVGIIVSVSSVIGLFADLILPQVVAGFTLRRLIYIAIVLCYVFAGLLYVSVLMPVLFVFFLSMAVWGVYFELIAFVQKGYVGQLIPRHMHASVWGFLWAVKSSAYFLGPIIASSTMKNSYEQGLFVAMFFVFVAVLLLFSYHDSHGPSHGRLGADPLHITTELRKWKTLLIYAWPVVAMSILVGLIDALFWTIGPIFTEYISSQEVVGNLFLPLFVLPSIFMGFVIAGLGITKHKKKLSLLMLFASGCVLGLFVIVDHIIGMLSVVFVVSMCVFGAYPLIDGVYSDLVGRMKDKGIHMIGLSSSTLSIAYIIGPPLVGAISHVIGMKNTFSAMGVSIAFISAILYMMMPVKITLPQHEIASWKS